MMIISIGQKMSERMGQNFTHGKYGIVIVAW